MLEFIVVFIIFFILMNLVPRYKYIYISKGTKLIEAGEVEKGLELFHKGCQSKKVDYMTKIRYAFTELKFGDLKKAKQMLMIVLNEKIPNNIRYEAKSIYALILYKEGQPEDAKEVMLEVYENYKNTNMFCTLGYLFNILESPENAVKFNEEAYEYNSDHNVIIDNLGQSYYLNGENEKATEIYEELMEKEPKFPEAYFNYGLVLLKNGKDSLAQEMFNKALEKPFNNLTTITKEEVERYIRKGN